MNKSNFRTLIGIFLGCILIWWFPQHLGLTTEVEISNFRSQFSQLANIIYAVLTGWLVLETRKMAIDSNNAHKATNLPQFEAKLLISDDQNEIDVNGKAKIFNSDGSSYSLQQQQAGVFLILENQSGGRASNININIFLNVTTSAGATPINRKCKISNLRPGDIAAIYLYSIVAPNTQTCSVQLESLTVTYQTIYGLVSNETDQFLPLDNGTMAAYGNLAPALTLAKNLALTNKP